MYEGDAKIFKALSDPNRLKIIDIISCGELCACDLLEHFKFTQPTLSHHMKVLMECGLVKSRKDGLWTYYYLDRFNCNKLMKTLQNIFEDTGNECICHGIKKEKCNIQR